MSTPTRYHKKPGVVEAMLYNGTPDSATLIIDWALSSGGSINYWCEDGEGCRRKTHVLQVSTLKGTVTALPGDFIIKGAAGEFHVVKPNIFAANYEEESDR